MSKQSGHGAGLCIEVVPWDILAKDCEQNLDADQVWLPLRRRIKACVGRVRRALDQSACWVSHTNAVFEIWSPDQSMGCGS